MSTGSFVGVLGVASDDSAESPGVVVEKPVDPAVLKIRAERELSEAVREYLAADAEFERASGRLSKCWSALRVLTNDKPNTQVVVGGGYGRFSGNHYLLTINSDGSFNVNSVEVI